MRVLTNLRRLLSALFGAVLRRKPRGIRADIPPLNDPAEAPAVISGIVIAKTVSAGIPCADEKPGIAVAQAFPDEEAECQPKLSSEDTPFANRHAPDGAGSEPLAGASVGLSTATAGAALEPAAVTANMRDQSVHTVEPTNPLPTCDTQVDASPATEISEPKESLCGAAAETSAATDEAVALLPSAAEVTTTAHDQSTHAVETAEPASPSTHAATNVDSPPAPEISQTTEAPPDAATSEMSVATGVVMSPDAVNEAGVEAAFTADVENEPKPEYDESLPDARSPLTIDQLDLDAELLLEEEIYSGEEVQDLLDESGTVSGATEQTQASSTSQRRSSTWQRRPEPSSEYPAIAPSALSTDYRTWNRAIAEHLLLKSPTVADVYLTITPRILARALMEVQGTVQNPDEAQTHFANAVSEMYRSRVLSNRARLRVLRRVGDDGLPECIAFLALTVLAAYRMHGDDEATGLAYYLRLGELLQCELSGPYPMGFDPFVFESLWLFLKNWLVQRDRKLTMPAPETGSRRFVRLPLAHVPLRSLDIDKLPDFFVWAGYQPSSEVIPDRLSDDFARWVRARSALTPTGVAAFADARRTAVLAEIRAELDSWDGSCDESIGRRSASVEILFDPVQHRPELFYLPRRPSGFPARFDDGVHVFEGSDDGWYGRVLITPSDGPDLARGFSWQGRQSGVEFALRRAATSVISMAPGNDYSGFMSARGLRRNVQCAVLCQEDVAKAAAEYLSHVTERPCRPLQHSDLPTGWSLFSGIVAHRLATAPTGLESLDVQANVGLIPSGGIRLGNRWSWLQGAPPRIIVTGSEPGIAVTIDDRPIAVDPNGLLQAGEALTTLGAHVIQVGPVRRTVEIVEPSIHVASSMQTQRDGASAPTMLALPPGRWTVVGVAPGQVARSKYALRGGTIVTCAFLPAWAIRVGPARGATVLNVFPGPGVPSSPDMPRGRSIKALSSKDMLGWISSIYDAAVRQPRIGSLATTSDPAAVIASWKTYARCANQLKRATRNSHR